MATTTERVFDYAFRIPLMRLLIVRLVVASALAGPLLVSCANRGMIASSEETGTGGGSGSAPALGGSSGSGGGSKVDASCGLVTDALFDHSTTICGAMFNFEGTTEGATLLAGSQAFTAVSQGTTPRTYCGAGSLAIAAAFSGTSGATTKGEVDMPLGVDGGSVDLSGKTLTVHASASPVACGDDLRLRVVLDTTSGSPVVLSINGLTSNFTTASTLLGGDAGAHASNKLAIEVLSISGYTGTIYVDEIDIR